jgi:cytochrome c-type biogenesis protein CcmH
MRTLLLILAFLATPLLAVEPSEMLDDPILEERARALSAELRCPVCRNESIDESNATLAKELRIVLRERLVEGDTDADIMNYMVARYGEFVLLKPDATGINIALWFAAPGLFLIAFGVGWGTIRRRSDVATDPLSIQEKEELEKILRK